MIASIVALYAFLIWLVFDKLRLFRLTLPLAILLAAVGPLFVVYALLSMNHHHPSSSDARVFQKIVQITPRISTPGRVLQVLVRPNMPMKAEEVLFKIDPRPFQFEVNRLEAVVAAAEQTVPQLKASLDQASALLEKANVQLSLSDTNYQRQLELFEKKVISQAALDRAVRDQDTARQSVLEAKAAEERARLAFTSNIGAENTTVAQARQQLAAAKLNLEETVVAAPCDGYVTNLQLQPGAIVSAAMSVMPFVCDRDDHDHGVVVATFMQGPYLRIAPGDYAEVVLPMYPGRVFPGKVLTTIDIAPPGQLTASGVLPSGFGTPGSPRFAVRIRLDDAGNLRLPAGAQGSAAVFTGNAQFAGIIRMALMRMESWTNYLFVTA